jgi:hypothetical protein
VVAVSLVFGDAARPPTPPSPRCRTASSPASATPHDTLAALPNSLLAITLTSNFGTFILYALSCFLCIVAFHKRPDYNFLKHCSFPASACSPTWSAWRFYLIGPFFNLGTKGAVAALGISGALGHLRSASTSFDPPSQGQSRSALKQVVSRQTRKLLGGLLSSTSPVMRLERRTTQWLFYINA